MNIVEAILFQCRINPDALAVCVPGGKIQSATYGQLERMMNNVSASAAGLQFKHGDVVGLMVEDAIFHIALTYGLMRLGVITVPCRGNVLPKELNAKAVITDSIQMFENAGRTIRADLNWVLGSDGKAPVDDGAQPVEMEDICRITLTSGTTGTPKCVPFTHRLLIERNARFDYVYGPRWPQCSRLYCDLGLSAAPTFRFITYSLMRGTTILLHGDDVANTALSLGLYKMQHMATSPHGLAQHVKFYQSQSLFRCDLDHILVAGGLLPKELAEQARASMSHTVISYYGATEAGSIATADSRLIADTPGAAGFVLPGATAEIVDQAGKPLPAGTEGVVRVKTQNLADGYFGDPEQSKRSFRDGFFHPGDLGYLTREGLLVITGREETRLNVGGDKVNPEFVETVLSAFPGVSDSAVFTVANELGVEEVYALIVSSSQMDEKALRSHCEARLQRIFVPIRFIPVDRIPRSQMGKIERPALRALAKSRLGG